MTTTRDRATCRVCGAPLVRSWRGWEFEWVDGAGRRIGGLPPVGYASGAEWLAQLRSWLLVGDRRGYPYTFASAARALGGLWPWEHVHQAQEIPHKGDVPWHCEMPMQRGQHGWRCRECKYITGGQVVVRSELAA